MTDSRAEIEDIWDRIDPAGEGPGYSRLRITDPTEIPIYAARQHGTGLETLMVEVTTSSVPPRSSYPGSRGITVRCESVSPGPRGRTRMLICLEDVQFRDVFVSLASDLVGKVRHFTDETACVNDLVTRVESWQAFLRHIAGGTLGPEARIGLFGELWFLSRHLLGTLPPHRALEAWRGPAGAAQDFQLPACTIEIKTTSASSPHAFRVSNLLQLEPAGDRPLIVFLLVIEETPAGTHSIPALLEEIRQALSPRERDLLDDRLFQVGYLRSVSHRYEAHRYSVRSRRTFEVGPGFPRLRESDLPPGVEDVKHAIAIASCAPFEISLDHIAGLVRDSA